MPLGLAFHQETIFLHGINDGECSNTIILDVRPLPQFQRFRSGHLRCEEDERCLSLAKEIESSMRDLTSKESRSIPLQLYFHDNFNLLNVDMSGELLGRIHNIIFWGTERESETLNLEIELRWNNRQDHSSPENTFTIRDFKQNCNTSMMLYEKKKIKLPREFSQWFSRCGRDDSTGGECSLVIAVRLLTTEGFVPLVDTDGDTVSHLGALYSVVETGKFTDFEIATKDGTVIPCHKLLLCESKVIQTMLDGEDNHKNGLELLDVSNEAAKGLVDFVQLRKRDAFMVPAVALELFQLADAYNISSLREYSMTVLLGKSHVWYDTDTALNLLGLSDKYTGEFCEDLKEKAFSVVKKKMDTVEQCDVYKDICETAIWKEFLDQISDEQ